MLIINNENFVSEIEKSETLCVIDLYADWCAPCRALAPTLETLEAEHPDVKFCKINIDKEPRLAEIFRVESIPLVAFVKDGTYLDMSIGLVPKASIEKMIAEYK